MAFGTRFTEGELEQMAQDFAPEAPEVAGTGGYYAGSPPTLFDALSDSIEALAELDQAVAALDARHTQERIAVYGDRKRCRAHIANILQEMGLTGFSIGAGQ